MPEPPLQVAAWDNVDRDTARLKTTAANLSMKPSPKIKLPYFEAPIAPKVNIII